MLDNTLDPIFQTVPASSLHSRSTRLHHTLATFRKQRCKLFVNNRTFRSPKIARYLASSEQERGAERKRSVAIVGHPWTRYIYNGMRRTSWLDARKV